MNLAGTLPGSCPPAARHLRRGAGCTFAGLLVWAPLNFGSTRPGGAEILATGCALGTLLWLLSLVLGAPRPVLPTFVLVAVGVLVLAALPWMCGWVAPTHVAAFTQEHFARIAARWPVSVVWRTPGNVLALTLALAVGILPLIDLARSTRWATVFCVTLVATGALVAVVALAENYTAARGIYWRDDGRMPGNFCGTFYHHTSAGAYFNTVWPPALVLAGWTWTRATLRFRRGLEIVACLVLAVLVAAQASHVSRFPQLAALLVLPFLGWLLGWKIRAPRVWLVTALGLACCLVAVAGRTGDIMQRWRMVWSPSTSVATDVAPISEWPARMRADLFVPGGSEVTGPRQASWRTALRCIAERPLLGHGPANWMGAASQNTADPFLRTFFQFVQFTHQDLLQFAVEWGIPAALAWWAVLIGAVVVAVRESINWPGPRQQLGAAAAVALVAVLLQSQIDFPLQIPAVALNVVVLAAIAWGASVWTRREAVA